MFVYKMRLIKQLCNLYIVTHTSVHPVTWSLLVNHTCIPLIFVAQVSAECERQRTVRFLILQSAECVAV
jgi:hypothetical protein